MSLSDFRLSSVASRIHRIPRFGHSNSAALLASSATSEEYEDGIIAFSACVLTLLFIWMVVVLVLKFYCGRHRVGCAAGGDVVDVLCLKKENHLSKKERKEWILRNWRVQTVCLLACVGLLVVSMLMLRLGLTRFIASLADMQEINDQVDSRAYRGIRIAELIRQAHDNLVELQRSGHLEDTLSFEHICPNLFSAKDAASANSSFTSATLAEFFPKLIHANVVTGLDQIGSIVESYDLDNAVDTLFQVTNVTADIDSAIDTVYNHDWMLKLLVVIMDVVVIFLIVGILISKDNTDFPAYQMFSAWLLIPVFCGTLVAIVSSACIFVSLAMLNADFCSGSGDEPSPLGTIRDMVVENGYSAGSLPYRAMEYYGSDCLTTDPTVFLTDIESTVSDTYSQVSKLYSILNSRNFTYIVEACGNDNSTIVAANATLNSLDQIFSDVQGSLTAAIELTGCSSISPVLRRLLFGSACTQSVEGLAWIYSSLLVISVLGFVILSTRAALFNPVIRGRRNKRREKEFDDYREFMSRFYDTSRWELDWIPTVDEDAEEIDVAEHLQECDSGETPQTTDNSPNISDDDDAVDTTIGLAPTISKDDGSIFVNLAAPDNEEDDDSYDSTYSVDEGNDDDVQSTSSSLFSQLFLRRRIRSQQQHDTSLGGDSQQDELLSTMSSSSMLNIFLSRRAARERLGDPLSLHPPDQHHRNHLNNDSHLDDSDNDDDSQVGVMLTPPGLRYSSRLQRLASSHRRQQPPHEDLVLDREIEPLSPSPSHAALAECAPTTWW